MLLKMPLPLTEEVYFKGESSAWITKWLSMSLASDVAMLATDVGWLCSGACRGSWRHFHCRGLKDTRLIWTEINWANEFYKKKKRSSGIFIKTPQILFSLCPKGNPAWWIWMMLHCSGSGSEWRTKLVLSAFNCCSEDCENFKSFHLNHLRKC